MYAVTPEDVRRVVAEHLRPEAMAIAVTGDAEQITEQLVPFGPIAGAGEGPGGSGPGG